MLYIPFRASSALLASDETLSLSKTYVGRSHRGNRNYDSSPASSPDDHEHELLANMKTIARTSVASNQLIDGNHQSTRADRSRSSSESSRAANNAHTSDNLGIRHESRRDFDSNSEDDSRLDIVLYWYLWYI